MIAKLKPYLTYKFSGVEWLGDVPEHWDVVRSKYLLQESDIRSLDGSEGLLRVSQYTGVTQLSTDTEIPESGRHPASLVGYKCVEPSDLVVNIMLAWNGSMGVSRFSGIVSPAYCVYQFKSDTCPRYFHYLLRSISYKAKIKAESTGIVESRLRLYTDDLFRIKIHMPPLPEQIAIARFLNNANRRIRHYICTKEKLIELLKEQKQIIIQQAVTGQIDVRTGQPYPAYKPSGVEWLRDVPEHWEVRRLRNIAETNFSNVDKHSKDDERQVRLCNYSDVYYNDRIRSDMDFMKATASEEEINRFRLMVGDVLITKDSEAWDDIGVPAFVESTDHDLVCGYHLALLRPNLEWVSGEFLHCALSCPDISIQLYVRANGVTRFGLSQNAIKSVWLPVPSPSEQTAIARLLNNVSSKLDDGINRTLREIELLREYRTRLYFRCGNR